MIKKIAKKIAFKLGYDVRSYIPEASASAQLLACLRRFEIDLVLDVGANKGQFASEVRDSGFAGEMVSFEPLADAYAALQQASRKDAKWTTHNCAIGDYEGQITINVAANSVSSSILPMLHAHEQAAPKSVYKSMQSVELRTLDALAPQYLAKGKNIFLKIDTQGFEWAVLGGAGQLLPVVRVVLVELSLIPLYEGQHLWKEVMAFLEARGFTLWALQPGFTSPETGRMLQMDGIFVRI